MNDVHRLAQAMASRRMAPVLALSALLTGTVAGCQDAAGPTVTTFQVAGRFSQSRHDPAIAVLPDGRILIAGGATPGGTLIPSAEIFDPSSGTTVATACDLVIPRRRAVAVTTQDGRILIVGGHTGNLFMLLETEVFDPSAGCFTLGPSLRERRSSVETVLRLPDGRMLVIKGASLNPDSVAGGAEIIAADLGLVQVLNRDLGEETDRASVGVLADGRVLLVGGNIVGVDRLGRLHDRVLLFDPTRLDFTLLSSRLSEAKSFMTVLPTPDGGALIIGGGGLTAVPTVERFDPATGVLRRTGELRTPRTLASAVIVGGRALVVGGKTRFGQLPLATTEWISFGGQSAGAGPSLVEGAAIGHRTFVTDLGVVVVRPGGDPAGDSTTAIQVGAFAGR